MTKTIIWFVDDTHVLADSSSVYFKEGFVTIRDEDSQLFTAYSPTYIKYIKQEKHEPA